MNWLLVFVGGGLGASFRYLMQILLGRSDGHSLPVSTLITNLTGCFIIGILTAISMKIKWNETYTLFLMTGFLGGFTTFSSFSIEFIQLLKNNHFVLALLYFVLSNFVGLALSGAGYYFFK